MPLAERLWDVLETPRKISQAWGEGGKQMVEKESI